MVSTRKEIVFARMLKEDVSLIKEVSKARSEDLSDFVRRSIYRELGRMGYLSEEKIKALGLEECNG
jgi:uncharacterized protein (DUF1778 family)